MELFVSFFKQKSAYEMRSSDWSSDVFSSDLTALLVGGVGVGNAVRSYLEGKTATIATLKCLGAPGRLIFQVYMAQILALALVGIVVGLVLGAAATYLAAGLLGDALGWRAELGIYPLPLAIAAARPEERRVGNECVST